MSTDEGYFNLELPERTQQEKVVSTQKGGASIFGRITIVVAAIGLIILSLPFIICGGFVNILVPIIVIAILIFAIRGLAKHW